VAPGLNGLILFGDKAFLTFDSELPYTAYANYQELNFLNVFNSARVTFPLGRFGIYTEGRYDRDRKVPVDLNDVRPVYTTRELGAGAILETSDRTAIELFHGERALTHTDDDFGQSEIDLARKLDRVERVDRLTLSYEIAGRSQFDLSIDNVDIEFDTPNLTGIPGMDRDSVARSIVPGLTLGQGGRLVGHLEVGYAELVYDSSLLPGYSGAVGRGQLRYRPFRGMTWTLEGKREVDFSASAGNNYFILDGALLNTLYFLNPVLGFELELGRESLEFPVTSRVDDLTVYGAGIRMRTMEDSLGRRVEYRVKIAQRERVSTEPIRDRSRAVLNLDVVLGY
jgi:hypothetical protein